MSLGFHGHLKLILIDKGYHSLVYAMGYASVCVEHLLYCC